MTRRAPRASGEHLRTEGGGSPAAAFGVGQTLQELVRRRGSSGNAGFGSFPTIFLLLGGTGEPPLVHRAALGCWPVSGVSSAGGGPSLCFSPCTRAPPQLCVTVKPERAECSRALADSHQTGLCQWHCPSRTFTINSGSGHPKSSVADSW